MSKICAKCGIEKPESEFRKDCKSKDGLGCWCKECDREYKRNYYAQNREKIRQSAREKYWNDPEYRQKVNSANNESYRANIDKRKTTYKEYCSELQEYINSLKTPCAKCGESRLWLLQFHHVIPDDKKFQIQARRSKKQLDAESKKCICLCSNCHSEYHYFYGNHPENPKESLEYYLSKEFDYNAVI